MNKHYIRTPRVEHERKVNKIKISLLIYGINKITMASKSLMNVFAIGVKLSIIELI